MDRKEISMTIFLGCPCICGWSYQEIDEKNRFCEKCQRRWIKHDWGWEQVTTKENIKEDTK